MSETTLADYEGVQVERGDGWATISDRRQDKTEPLGFVVATDSFLSGWGSAPGRSLYAAAVANDDERRNVERQFEKRDEFKYVRFNMHLPRLRRGDHLAIVDKKDAPIFYEGPY